jgi:ankyrin repeat protein
MNYSRLTRVQRNAELLKAATEGNMETVNRLLAAGANIDIQDEHKQTPLFIAAWKGHIAIVERLLAAGANVDVQDENTQSPLFIAVSEGHTAIVERLLAAGANIDVQGVHKQTPLFNAAWKGHTAIVERLLAAGANIDIQDVHKQTPLFIAARVGHIAIVERLLAAGANIDIQDNYKQTPLFIATWEGHTAIVERLLAAGANPNIKNKDGKSAFDIAKEKGFNDIVRLLTPVWKGFSRSDIDALNSIFETEGPNPRAVNSSCCPVCLKIVAPGRAVQFEIERSEACRYMTHNCVKEGGYFHKKLYETYKTPEGNITWCTVCGRICTGHKHHKLVLAKNPKSVLLPSKDPFNMVPNLDATGHPIIDAATGRPKLRYDPDSACKRDGGGGLMEKLARYRRMREFAFELQDKIGKIKFDEAVDTLLEETWNAPLVRKLALAKIAATKTWNIPSERFYEIRNMNIGNTANVPWPFEGRPDMLPIVSVPVDGNMNAITMGDIKLAVQLRHRQENGTIVLHDKIDLYTLFGKDGFGSFSAAGTPEFGKCFFRCGAIIYPGELQYIIDNSKGAGPRSLTDETYAEYKAKIEIYRKRFNEEYSKNAAFKDHVDADIAAAGAMAVGGAGVGHVGGKRCRTRKRQMRHRQTKLVGVGIVRCSVCLKPQFKT